MRGTSRVFSEAEPKTKAELSASHTCALNESKSETQHEFSAAGSAVVILEIPYGMRQGIEKENGEKYPE